MRITFRVVLALVITSLVLVIVTFTCLLRFPEPGLLLWACTIDSGPAYVRIRCEVEIAPKSMITCQHVLNGEPVATSKFGFGSKALGLPHKGVVSMVPEVEGVVNIGPGIAGFKRGGRIKDGPDHNRWITVRLPKEFDEQDQQRMREGCLVMSQRPVRITPMDRPLRIYGFRLSSGNVYEGYLSVSSRNDGDTDTEPKK